MCCVYRPLALPMNASLFRRGVDLQNVKRFAGRLQSRPFNNDFPVGCEQRLPLKASSHTDYRLIVLAMTECISIWLRGSRR